MIVTKVMLERARTPAGGYTGAQITIARGLAGRKKNVFRKLLGMDIDPEAWERFHEARYEKKKNEKPVKLTPEQKAEKRMRDHIERVQRKAFYLKADWQVLRVRVLEKYGCKCMMCGRSPKDHGIVIHVDHIKPKSKYPELAMEESNLQILCEDCNLGKSNYYETDWRPSRI